VATAEQVALNKEMQTLEASERGPLPTEFAPAIDIEHGTPQADPHAGPPAPLVIEHEAGDDRPRGEPPPVGRSPGDEKRLAMQARFRQQRAEEAAEDAELAADAEALRRGEELPQPPNHDPVSPGDKIRLVVRGREIEVSPEDLIKLAQQSAAGDSYLAEARATLDQAKREAAAMLEGARRNAPPTVSPQDLDEIYDQVAYGDPDTAKEQLAAAIDAKAQERIQQGREVAELTHSQEVLAAFVRNNPELAADPIAMGAMEQQVFAAFGQDLAKAGYDVNQLRSSGDLSSLHMKMRAAGHPVRKIEDIFDAVKSDFLAWRRGVRPAAPPADDTPPAPLRQGAPRVVVNVDRNARRANIPTQPPRSASPQRQPLMADPERSQQENRAQAFQKIAAQRAKGRGRYVSP
jgi:hypothetical protein